MLAWVPLVCTHGTLNTPTKKAQLTGYNWAASARTWKKCCQICRWHVENNLNVHSDSHSTPRDVLGRVLTVVVAFYSVWFTLLLGELELHACMPGVHTQRREAPLKHDKNVATKYEEPSIFQNNELSIFTLFTFFHVFHVDMIGCNKYCSCNNDTNGIYLLDIKYSTFTNILAILRPVWEFSTSVTFVSNKVMWWYKMRIDECHQNVTSTRATTILGFDFIFQHLPSGVAWLWLAA